MFTLLHPVTRHLTQQITASILAYKRPSHAWRDGLVLVEMPAEVRVLFPENKLRPKDMQSNKTLEIRVEVMINRNTFWSQATQANVSELGFSTLDRYTTIIASTLYKNRHYYRHRSHSHQVGSSSGGLWLPGMRLEAIDRATPGCVAPASVAKVEGNQVLIYFDGWSDNYDYWTEVDNEDLHPVG